MTADFLPAWPLAFNSFVLFGLLLLAGALGGRLAATTRVLVQLPGGRPIGEPIRVDNRRLQRDWLAL